MINNILKLLSGSTIEDLQLGIALMQEYMSQEEFDKHILNRSTSKCGVYGYYIFKDVIYYSPTNLVSSHNASSKWEELVERQPHKILYKHK